MVVIDILRATSTIVTALGNKALEVIPVIEPVEVTDLIKAIGSRECLTGGERKGLKIEGFDWELARRIYRRAGAGKKLIFMYHQWYESH